MLELSNRAKVFVRECECVFVGRGCMCVKGTHVKLLILSQTCGSYKTITV